LNRYIVRKQPRRWTYLRDVLSVLVARDFKVRYKRSFFGVTWSLMVPLAQFFVLYLVFNAIVPLGIPHYTVFLFSGFLPWTWLQSSLLVSALAVVDNRELVKQPGFPVTLLPTISVLSQSIHFLLALPVVGVFLVIDGYRAGLPLAALPLIILLQLIQILGLAYIVATLQVKFRDTQYLLGIVLFLAFYLTPVFWSEKSIQEPYRSMMQWNPLAVTLDGYRAILVRGEWPTLVPMLTVAAGSIVILVLSYSLFSTTRHRFVEEL
jgi:lipopolysaccharide transport system permease protein